MYGFPLTPSQRDLIQTWLSLKDKPLFITGISGCGKSTLANKLLKEYHIVPIHSDHLKYSGDIINLIQNTLFKKDVLMMCSRNPYKSLLIDDIQLFIRYDKSGLSRLIDFVKTINDKYPIILVSDNISHKYIDIIQSISYTIQLNFSMRFYKTILKKEDIPDIQLNRLIQTSDRNLHSLKVNGHHTSTIDKRYSINDVIQLLFTNKITIVDLFRLCSSEYNTLSLNILENTPFIIKPYDINILAKVYSSVCMGDFIESKYIDKNIDLEVILLFSCILPRNYIYSRIHLNKDYIFKFNSYISKSLIQIHNQSLLSTIDYMNILKVIYESQLKDKLYEIKEKISFFEFDMKTLYKQIKVYNYYFNKDLTKKYVTKIFKSILE